MSSGDPPVSLPPLCQAVRRLQKQATCSTFPRVLGIGTPGPQPVQQELHQLSHLPDPTPRFLEPDFSCEVHGWLVAGSISSLKLYAYLGFLAVFLRDGLEFLKPVLRGVYYPYGVNFFNAFELNLKKSQMLQLFDD